MKQRKYHIDSESEYKAWYQHSINDPHSFWDHHAKALDWLTPYHTVVNADFARVGSSSYVNYFEGGELNVSYNCVDRHASEDPERVAIYWEGESGEERTVTYQELFEKVSKTAQLLLECGVQRGERVTIFMPMIPELAIAMLACARIGAIHSVVFSAFSLKALVDRMVDCASSFVITADIGHHNGKEVPLKTVVDEAVKQTTTVRGVLVHRTLNAATDEWLPHDVDWKESLKNISKGALPVAIGSEDPLFILYTSGSTGKPKAVLHTSAGYLLYTYMTFKYIFDYHKEDVYWCTADLGWITGHSYVVYGPLSNGATLVMYEGAPLYPDAERYWRIIERYRVTIFYTAPTAIRMFMKLGEEGPKKYDLSSLRLLGSVGEPINPEAWLWYHRVIGNCQCPIVDTWWQTETGGILLTTLPGVHLTKPGAAGLPFFGVVPRVEDGALFIERPWPGMLRGLYNDTAYERTRATYFSIREGAYFSGDGCEVDSEGYHWLKGRMDDVLNVAGHRLSTAEIESALVAHPAVAEAAVVGVPHATKGQGVYCFVTLKSHVPSSLELEKALVCHVRQEISPIATPHAIHFASGLPKTRSGKIMRRILRKIASHEVEELGDLSTLADPAVIDHLIATRKP